MHYRLRVFPNLWILLVLYYVGYDGLWRQHAVLTPSFWLAFALMIIALLLEQLDYHRQTIAQGLEYCWFHLLRNLALIGPFSLAAWLLKDQPDMMILLKLVCMVYVMCKASGILFYGILLALVGLNRAEHAASLHKLVHGA